MTNTRYVAQCSRRQLRAPILLRRENETVMSAASSAVRTPQATAPGR